MTTTTVKRRERQVDPDRPVPVRLDLSPDDHKRLERAAKRIGLKKASFARFSVLNMVKTVEGEIGDIPIGPGQPAKVGGR
jgi:hypothetical protein